MTEPRSAPAATAMSSRSPSTARRPTPSTSPPAGSWARPSRPSATTPTSASPSSPRPGEKFFCPGWDLKAAAGGDAVDGDYGVGGFGGLQELPHLDKPVIAAVNGIACGGGLELALSCDIILAAEHATFALPEIRSGTVADAASIKLPKRIPYHIAMEMLLTGRWIDADEAHRWGLVNRDPPGRRAAAAPPGRWPA